MSYPFGGHEASIAFCEELSYGELPAEPAWYPPFLVEDLEPTVGRANINIRGLGSRDLHAIKKGLQQASLKFTKFLQTYETLKVIDAAWSDTLRSFYVEVLYEKGSEYISLRFPGSRFDKITVNCEIENVIKAKCELIAQKALTATSKLRTTGNPYSEPPYAWYDSYVKKDTTVLERVTSWSWSVANNLKRVPVIRSSDGDVLKYLPWRHRDITGELVFEFETKEEADDILNDTDFTLEIGLGGSHKAVFSNCKWNQVTIPTTIADLAYLKAPFTAKSISVS